MQAVILAAGNSSRFQPFNASHKSMIQIMGKTILEHTLLSARKSGITHVVIVVSENSTIPREIGDGKKLGLTIVYVVHEGAKGMGAALLDAKEHLQERFFLLNAYHADIELFAKNMQDQQVSDTTVVLLAKKPSISTQFGVIEINGDRVVGVEEKPKKILDTHLQIIGMYLLNKKFIDVLEQTPLTHYHFEKALDTWAGKGNIRFVKTQKQTVSLKYSWDILSLKNFLLENMKSFIDPSAEIAKTAIVTGHVSVGKNTKIMEGVVIKGPCFIGDNVVIGDDVILRDNVDVENSCVIGARMEIKNSLISEGTTTHSGFIGDSVVGKRTKIAGYFCTANVRLDRKPVEVDVKDEKVSSELRHLGTMIGNDSNIGIRVSTMPGVVVGNNVIIGPSTTIMRNISDKTKYYTRFQEIVELHEK